MSRDELLEVVLRLPIGDVRRLGRSAGGGEATVRALAAESGSPELRHAYQLVDAALSSDGTERIAGWLDGVAAAVDVVQSRQQVDIVWTGPDSDVDTVRLTAQVVVDLISAARRTVLLCSFATTAEARIREAIAEAVARGVDVTALYERRVDNPAYTSVTDAFSDLGVRRLGWPANRRPAGAALHPEFLVIDDHTALVGSANLTGRALDVNLECGVLLRGGPGAAAVSGHIWSLVRAGELEVVA